MNVRQSDLKVSWFSGVCLTVRLSRPQQGLREFHLRSLRHRGSVTVFSPVGPSELFSTFALACTFADFPNTLSSRDR
jgi:hypothetical protein